MHFFSLSRYPRFFIVLGALLVITVTSACDVVSVQPHPPVPTATPVLPTPTPSLGKLSPPPTDCPVSPPLDALTTTVTDPGFGGPVAMIGHAPVWAPRVFLHERTYALPQPTSAYPWSGVKIMWQIGPKSYPKVTVRAHDLKTGDLAWWWREADSTSGPKVPVLVMDPLGDAHGTVRFDWVEYRTGLVVGHAGCYKVDVTWPGGEWYIILAVGGDSSP
jgi:hypothetical protein